MLKPTPLSLLVLLMSGTVAAGQFEANPWEAAEALFRQDSRWLGSDGAISTPLDEHRIYWSFDDTFIGLSAESGRENSWMVRNSIAIQTGTDPLNSTMAFHWNDSGDTPSSFFPEQGENWFWTGAAIRLEEGPLLQFLIRQLATPGQDLGFGNDGWDLALISNPDDPVADWNIMMVPGPKAPFDALPASALLRQGEYVVGLSLRQQGAHAGALVRYLAADLAAGNLASPQWWAGQDRGWLEESEIGAAGPAWVMDDAGSENSIHFDGARNRYMHVATYGFGAARIGVRTASSLTGPWSDRVIVYEPPELALERPFIYAAMAHPHLEGPQPGALVVTYATNSWEFGELFVEPGISTIYWPRVITIQTGK